jgi:dTDP-4-amino-4,6-dideoxygalactose transaminase
MIPFLDMKARHAPLRAEFLRTIGEVIDSGHFAGGEFVERFEQEFAAYCGVHSAVGVGSGTEALWLTLLAMGIGPGDEVVTVPMTFAATVEAICQTGATPVFADIDEATYTMDPACLEKVITRRTRAVIPVHLFGMIAEMDPIMEIAASAGLRVIEDAAQAHGSRYKGRMAGSLADAACFSFYPGKNLGAFGDGGAVLTNDEGLAMKVRVLGNHGQTARNRHALPGWNSRLDAIQAAVLRLKLPMLDSENQQRREHASFYNQALAATPGVITPQSPDPLRHNQHLYAIRAGNRAALLDAFDREGIGYGLHYPVPVHLQNAYLHLGHAPGSFPVAERCAGEFVSLPVYPELTSSQLSRIADTLNRVAESSIAA